MKDTFQDKFAEVIDTCMRSSAEKYEDAQAIIEKQEKEIMEARGEHNRLSAICTTLNQSCHVLHCTLESLCKQLVEEASEKWVKNAGKEHLKWLEERGSADGL